MTRSVEIPDEAVAAAVEVLNDDGHNGIDCKPDRNLDDTVRAALVAARPYLMPTRDEITDLIQAAFYGSAAPTLAFEREESGKVADAILTLLSTEVTK